MATSITDEEIEKIRLKMRDLSNGAKYDEAYAWAKRLHKKHPEVLRFAYYVAVFSAEDDVGYTPAEVRKRHKSAAKKMRPLLGKLKGADKLLRVSIRNEYYWFSHQPYKQYLLGKEGIRLGLKRSHYSQGVGAVELAKKYGLQKRRGLCLKWAKISENAWLKFFKVDSKWYNSYFFYATALGLQGRMAEMERALQKCAKIAGKPAKWIALQEIRDEVAKVIL